MRAKIVLTSTLKSDVIKAIFPDNNKTIVWDLTVGSEGTRILDELMDYVADEDRPKAHEGALFVFFYPMHESYGFVSVEDGQYVIRVKNEGIYSLRETCEALVGHIADYCKRNGKDLQFVRPVTILEMKLRRPIIFGKVLVIKKDMWAEVKRKRHVEFWVSIVGGLTFILLVAISLYWTYTTKDEKQTWWFATWSLDQLSKLIGSISVASILSAIQLCVAWNGIRSVNIKWSIPDNGDEI
ncbi:hypothetical protein [Fundidesulfovibrio putealis]|uniref:hypothetical protein n=1 Tax=Fundidesulfovibrio putealis TaxID=270496 RepID=UPI0012EBFE7B|nr:hypothetical protein [Fundidesulfovibrio putealis]